jgi:two-component system, OmpR family, phosphate regulon sensor histidine kinase PhoR
MKKTLFVKIFLSYAALVAVLSGLILIFSFNSIKMHYIETEAGHLREAVIILDASTGRLIAGGNGPALETMIKSMTQGTDLRYTVIKLDGNVLADSGSDPARMDNHAHRPEVRDALSGKEGQSLRYSNTIKEDMLYLSRPFRDSKGKITAILRASRPLNDIKKITASINSDIIKASVFALFAAIIATFIFARRFYTPISDLALASQRVAAGDFDAKVIVTERGELKELADNFNSMTGRIKELFDEVRLKKDQLDAVLSSIAEGLIVVDEKGKIILMNKSFKKISGTDCGEGSFYWECFMPPLFNESVENSLKYKRNFTEQIEIKEKVYLCSGAMLEAKDQAAIILYDITEFKDLERIKKDFVANVSHELRTPLTAIKGFTETIEESTKDAEERHYLDIIKKHTERLINIVNDLLTLSQLEQMEKAPLGDKVNLNEVIANAAKIFEQAIKQKGLGFTVNVDAGVPVFKGDFFRFEQVFINLIDNAVKYTEKGGINVSARRDNGNIRIEVADTGLGIPPEHLPRIFERFYTVDKSRSRKLGGTGLGLAIVKHIVLMHGGTITAESSPGTGTKFIIIIPVSR